MFADVEVVLGAPFTEEPPSDELYCADRTFDLSDLSGALRSLTLRYVVRRAGIDEQVEDDTDLVGQPMRFGGYRWWLACPKCGSLRRSVYLPRWAGGTRWRCRQCYGLRYRVQRLGTTARIEHRMRHICGRLQPRGWEHWLHYPPPKPKWMRFSTYGRHVGEWKRARDARNSRYCATMSALIYRLSRRLEPLPNQCESRHSA